MRSSHTSSRTGRTATTGRASPRPTASTTTAPSPKSSNPAPAKIPRAPELFRGGRRGTRVTRLSETRPADDAVVDTTFDEVFPELFRSGYRVAYRLLGSREDAPDCAQEACARACADWTKLPPPPSPVPWAVPVSSNLAINPWRRA